MIPCIEEKCITYPVCKNKVLIECPKLKNLMNYLEENMTIKEMWSRVHEYFPNVLAIHRDSINKSSADSLGSIYMDRTGGVAAVLRKMDILLR